MTDAAGATLVMQEIPPGRFSRYDRQNYSLTEAVRVLNRELEPKGFRLVEKGHGKFLDVMFLRNARAEYYRPQLPDQRRTASYNPYARKSNGFDPVRKYQRSVQTISGRDSRNSGQPLGSGLDSHIRTAAHAAAGGGGVRAFPPLHVVEDRIVKVVATRNRTALEIARAIYRPLKSRTRLLDSGPSGMPAFQVMMPETSLPRYVIRQTGGSKPVVQFTVAIDSRRDELTIQGPKTQCQDVVELVQYLDAVEVKKGESLRVVATKSNPMLISKTLRPTLAYLAQAAAQPKKDDPPLPKGKLDPNAAQGVIPIIRGRVTIRDVPGVGLVITGNKEDVEAVMRIIQELDKQGLITAPNVHVHELRHVNSQALADLLTSVYRSLTSLRTGQAATTTTTRSARSRSFPSFARTRY